jgi:hypothetical protein
MRVRETYIWIAFAIIVIAVASYFRFYYQPSLSLNVSVGSGVRSLYPYQLLSIPITITNTGSASFSNLSLGLYINGNVSRVYKASIPAGKQATIYFNYTPTESGSYNISVVADPGRLYDITDRQQTHSSTVVQVMQASRADPYSAVNPEGLISSDSFNLSAAGYTMASYLYNNFSADKLELTASHPLNNFLYPMLDVYAPYIHQVSIAHAYYNKTYLVSMWIEGYLMPSAIYNAALGKSLNATTQGNLTVINLGYNTTMCSWYSQGWIKSLAVVGNESCTMVYNRTYSYTYTSPLYARLKDVNTSILSYSGFYSNISYAGDISIRNSSFVYRSLMSGPNFSNVCWGTVYRIDNSSYCGAFYEGVSNSVLVKYERLVGSYNISVWSLSSENELQNSINTDQGINAGYNFTGQKIGFVSGFSYSNTCYIDSNVICSNSTFTHNALSLRLKNTYANSITLSSIECVGSGAGEATQLDGMVLSPGNSVNMSTPCYVDGNVITGAILGSTFGLDLHYIADNKTITSNGYAYIV